MLRSVHITHPAYLEYCRGLLGAMVCIKPPQGAQVGGGGLLEQVRIFGWPSKCRGGVGVSSPAPCIQHFAYFLFRLQCTRYILYRYIYTLYFKSTSSLIASRVWVVGFLSPAAAGLPGRGRSKAAAWGRGDSFESSAGTTKRAHTCCFRYPGWRRTRRGSSTCRFAITKIE